MASRDAKRASTVTESFASELETIEHCKHGTPDGVPCEACDTEGFAFQQGGDPY